jgi:sodium/potassium-transporting ATPase subunit alpha
VYANLLYIAVPLPLPISAILILCTDLGFELFLALSFAWDSAESKSGLMKLPPRKPVTDESMARARKHLKEGKPGAIAGFIENWKNPIDQETLVDGEVLSWAYLESGTIETIGCLVCYFFAMWIKYKVTPADAVKWGGSWGVDTVDGVSPPIVILSDNRTFSVKEQLTCLASGQSAYYIAMLVQQIFNLFCCKARLRLPFGKFMFSNPKNFLGIAFGICFVCILVYVPFLNEAFGTDTNTSLLVWPIAMGFGFFLFFYSSVRFLIMRYSNPIKYSKDIQGLDLHPTRFSTGR